MNVCVGRIQKPTCIDPDQKDDSRLRIWNIKLCCSNLGIMMLQSHTPLKHDLSCGYSMGLRDGKVFSYLLQPAPLLCRDQSGKKTINVVESCITHGCSSKPEHTVKRATVNPTSPVNVLVSNMGLYTTFSTFILKIFKACTGKKIHIYNVWFS